MVNGAETNVARQGTATQSSTWSASCPASNAIDGNTDGTSEDKLSITNSDKNPTWWQVQLAADYEVTRVVIWNRQDGYTERLRGATVSLRNAAGVVEHDFLIGMINKPSFTFNVHYSGNIAGIRSSNLIDQCIGGSSLILRKEDSSLKQKWKIGVDGSIALDVDCSPYQTGNLAISVIEYDDIENYENAFFSFLNPASGMALSVQGTGCQMDKITTLRPYNPDDNDQKFKLLKSGDKFFIRSEVCAGKEGSLLSAVNCAEENTNLVLGPKQFCIKVVTGTFHQADGVINVYVDSGDGYILETEADAWYAQGEEVMEKCVDRLEGVQVTGTSGNAWGGSFYLSLDGGQTWDHESNSQRLICLDCTGSGNTMPLAVSGASNDGFGETNAECMSGRTCTLVPPEEIQYDRRWKIKKGILELDGCGTVASINSATHPPPAGAEIHVTPNKDSWTQKWTVISRDAVLLTENGSPSQEWKAHFAAPPYNYALLPETSFPGTLVGECLSSTADPEVSKSAMHYCDESMSLLIGSQTSLGTLRAITDVVKDSGLDRMPGSCCFDSPTDNDEYFGIEYNPLTMGCQNTGPSHLGISEEACHNAGGKWFRTPCVTLKEAIDARPFKFDTDNPVTGSCQDNLEQLNTAYVKASTADFCNRTVDNTIAPIRFVKVSLPGTNRLLNLAEVQVFAMVNGVETNVARQGTATQSSIYDGRFPASNAIDGNTGGNYLNGDTIIHTQSEANPWWQVELEQSYAVTRVVVWNRLDPLTTERLSGATVSLLNADEVVQQEFQLPEVTTNTHEFPFDIDDNECDCNEFCRGLPDYTNQVAMMTTGSTAGSADTCLCLYQEGGVPSSELLPEYATRSPPKFSLTDSANGMTIGINSGYDCSSDEITIKAQDQVNSVRMQFHLTYDNRLASAACLNKVLTADCASGMMVLRNPTFGPQTVLNQTWNFTDDGSITNADCPSLQISAIKDDVNTLDSFYFSLVNPTTSMVMGVVGDDCSTTEGTNITLQKAVPGSPNQLFYMNDNSDKIVSLMCPGMAVSISDAGACDSNTTVIQLKPRGSADTWQFNDDESLESETCSGKVLDINTPTRPAQEANSFWQDKLKQSRSGRKLSTAAGAALVLSNHTEDVFSMYKKWTRSHHNSTILLGPYSILNAASSVIGVDDVDCANEMALKGLADAYNSLNQQFYLGNGGVIHSSKCPGLVIAAPSGCADGGLLTLKTVTRDDTTKWIFVSDGSIESVKCPGFVIDIGSGSDAMLKVRDVDASSQVWRNVNTRLLDGSQVDWNQNWSVEFVEDYSGTLPTHEHSGDTTHMTCYTPNDAFSASFEDFAKDLVIDDASDEDQCRRAREMLNYDRDHAFDTEVRDTFNDYMCNGVEFTAVDHMVSEGGGLAGPPEFTEVEFEAPEYPDDPELPFDTLPDHTPIDLPDDIGSNDALIVLKQIVSKLKAIESATKLYYDYAKGKQDTACKLIGRDAWPDMPIFAIGAPAGLYTPIQSHAWIACITTMTAMKIQSMAMYVMAIVAHKAAAAAYSSLLIKPDKEWDQYFYNQATFNSLQNLDTWNFDALQTINKNIFKQHSEMREHLQDRHQAMTTDIVEFLEESTNTIAKYFTIQSDWLHGNLCVIYMKITSETDCKGNEDTLLGLVGLSLWDKMLRIEAQGENLTREIQMAQPVGADGETGDVTQGLLQVGAETNHIKSIHKSSSKVEEMVDLMEGKIDGIEGKVGAIEYSTRNTEAKIDVMEGKIGAMEGKIDGMEGKVDGMEASMQEVKGKVAGIEDSIKKIDGIEGKVNGIEGKLAAVERNVNDMKDMMSKMMDVLVKEG